MIKSVYLVFHKGDVVYVGSTKDIVRRRTHHYGDALKRVNRGGFCKYLRDNPNKLEFAWVEVYRGEDWVSVEEKTIAEHRIKSPKLLNRSVKAVGNNSPHNRTRYWAGKRPEAAIAASVKARLGKPLSEEHKAKQRAGHKRRKGIIT